MSSPGINNALSPKTTLKPMGSSSMENKDQVPTHLTQNAFLSLAENPDLQDSSTLFGEAEVIILSQKVKTFKECVWAVTQSVTSLLELLKRILLIDNLLNNGEATLTDGRIKALTGLPDELKALWVRVDCMATNAKPEHLVKLSTDMRRDLAKLLMKIPEAERRDCRPTNVSKEALQLWDDVEKLIPCVPLFQEEQQALDMPETIFAKEQSPWDVMTGDLFRKKTPVHLFDKFDSLRSLARRFWDNGQKQDAQALAQKACDLVPSIMESCGEDIEICELFMNDLVKTMIPGLDEGHLLTLATLCSPGRPERFFSKVARYWAFLGEFKAARACAARIVTRVSLREWVDKKIDDREKQMEAQKS